MTIGHLMLQRYDIAAVSAVIAVMGGLWVYMWYQREVKFV